MSYLSENVYHILHKIPQEMQKSAKANNIINSRRLRILGFMKTYFDEQGSLDVNRKRSSSEIVRYIWSKITEDRNCDEKLEKEQFVYIPDLYKWTGAIYDILVCLKDNEDYFGTNLTILKLTAIVERGLGDVFTSYFTSKTCPSLLKDLLKTKDLEQIFGAKNIAILQTLMGHPASLNLRNVLWHGFPMLGEIPSEYSLCIIELIGMLGKIIQQNRLAISLRPKLELKGIEKLSKVFPLISFKDGELIVKLFKSTAFIPIGMLPSWKFALNLFFRKRYSDAVVVFLPQLEHALRCLFTVVNNCPHRQQTAESDALYTTFDEILSKELNESRTNKLTPEIGNNLVELFFDLLFFPEGLRLRDRISHGEYSLANVDERIANHVICIGICLCLRYVFPWRKFLLLDIDLFSKLQERLSSYRSLYHPIPLLAYETELCLKKVQQLEDANKQVKKGTEVDAIENKSVKEAFLETSVLYFSATKLEQSEIVFDSVPTMVEQCVRVLIEKPRDVLYRPKYEIEIHQILRRIVERCSKTIEQVLETMEVKQFQQEQRVSRSRARQNYLNMLNVIPKLLLFCSFMLLVVSVESLGPSNYIFSKKKTSNTSRYLRRCLKYAENVSSLCGPSKNRWLECLEIVTAMLHLAKSRVENPQEE